MSPESKDKSQQPLLEAFSLDEFSRIAPARLIRVSVPEPSLRFFPFVFNIERQISDKIRELYRLADKTFIDDLISKGLLGEHELLARPNIFRGTWGDQNGSWELDGSMLLLFGNIHGRGRMEGNTRTVNSIQFAWQPTSSSGVLISEIPIDRIEFNETTDGPLRVSFQFNRDSFILNPGVSFALDVATFPNPNDYLKGDRLALATLKGQGSALEDIKSLLPSSSVVNSGKI